MNIFCTECKKEKPESEFYFNKSMNVWFRKCKICYNHKQSLRNKSSILKYINKYYHIKPTPKHIQNVNKFFETTRYFSSIEKE